MQKKKKTNRKTWTGKFVVGEESMLSFGRPATFVRALDVPHRAHCVADEVSVVRTSSGGEAILSPDTPVSWERDGEGRLIPHSVKSAPYKGVLMQRKRNGKPGLESASVASYSTPRKMCSLSVSSNEPYIFVDGVAVVMSDGES